VIGESRLDNAVEPGGVRAVGCCRYDHDRRLAVFKTACSDPPEDALDGPTSLDPQFDTKQAAGLRAVSQSARAQHDDLALGALAG